MKNTDMNTGYRVDGTDILSMYAHTGYFLSADCILHGDKDTGYYVNGEIIYRRPAVDTGFWISGGVILGPSDRLPFLH
jgi:hypothetical protein